MKCGMQAGTGPARRIPPLLFLSFAVLFAFLAAGPGTARSATPVTGDPGEQARTLGREDFLPALDPPRGIFTTAVSPLGDGAQTEFGLGANMNRVDGFSPLAAQALVNPGLLPSLRAYESYGMLSHRWSGAAEISVHPFSPEFSLGGRWGDETDVWPWPNPPVTPSENFAAAVLLGEDFENYLRRRGTTVFAGWRPGEGREFQVSFEDTRHEPLAPLRRRLGLFGGDKALRDNPPVVRARWELLRFRGLWAFGPVLDPWENGNAHAFLADIQGSPDGGRGTSRFFRLWGEQRGRQRLTPSQFVGYRLGGGWSRKIAERSRLPVEWLFRAGGLGSLRGHDFLEFAGDRMVLTTLEYGVETAARIQPILFLDGGRLWGGSDQNGDGVLSPKEAGNMPFALDGGIGLQLGTGLRSARIDIGRDLRAERSSARISLRFGTPY